MAIEVGDTVRIIFSPAVGGHGQGIEYKVEVVRSSNPGQIPYWVLSQDGIERVFDCPLILRKVE